MLLTRVTSTFEREISMAPASGYVVGTSQLKFPSLNALEMQLICDSQLTDPLPVDFY